MNEFDCIRDKDALIAAMRDGIRPKWLFFWGHQPAKDGSITKSCFSQWWPAPFTWEGDTYPTAEHFMMAEKARLFGDESTRQAILLAKHPKQAKALGRQVAGFDEAVWSAKRFEIVTQANRAKFEQHPALGEFLLGTGSRVLVEASPVDRVWGIGMAADDPACETPEHWRGLNLLGFALMEARSLLSGGKVRDAL